MTRTNYTRNEIIDIVKESIVKILKVDPSKITDDASVVSDLGADGLDCVELVISLEGKFSVPLQEKDLGSSGYSFTINDMVGIICRKLGIK